MAVQDTSSKQIGLSKNFWSFKEGRQRGRRDIASHMPKRRLDTSALYLCFNPSQNVFNNLEYLSLHITPSTSSSFSLSAFASESDCKSTILSLLVSGRVGSSSLSLPTTSGQHRFENRIPYDKIA